MANPEYTPGQQLQDLSRAFQAGSLPREQFQEHLEILMGDLDQWIRSLQAMEVPPATYDQDAPPLEKAFQGVELYVEAVGEMQAFLEEGEQARNDRALEMAREGDALIRQAKGETEGNVERLEDEL